MPRRALRRHLVEAAMLDADPRLVADLLETDLDLGVKIGREVRLPPRENQAMRRLPDADDADLEGFAAGPRFNQPTALARLERQDAGARRGLEHRARPPPGAD